jgi:choline kinase
MKAVLLVAGIGSRLGSKTNEIPKSLLKIDDKPILFYIVDRVIENGIRDFIVVVGFKKEMIINALTCEYPDVNFEFVENENYRTTNTMYSMYLAHNHINNGFVYMHADVIVNTNILKDLLDTKYKNGAIVEPSKESMQAFGSDGIITRISKKKDAIGKALGIYKFSQDAAEMLFEEAKNRIDEGDINSFQSAAINPTILQHRMDLVSTTERSWVEVDDENDLAEAEMIIKKILEEEKKEG